MANSYFPKQPISLAKQVIVMKQYFPSFRALWHKNIVQWVGEIQPGEISQCYRVKIIHQLHKFPQVFVLNPKLITNKQGKIPHTYPGKRLCLYHPAKQEWSQQMYIAKTIVPWTSLWLKYYEFWQVAGEWLGGGEHPEPTLAQERPIQIIRNLNLEFDSCIEVYE